jgi:dienelactone hydrolase
VTRHRTGIHSLAALGAAAATLGLNAGCSPMATPSAGSPRISVDKLVGLIDSALDITLRGLPGNQQVTVRATSTDADGRTFVSQATYIASASGTLDLASAKPVSGDYAGADSMGLLWSLQPPRGQSTQSSSFAYVPSGNSMRITFTAAVAAHDLASTSVTRELRAGGVAETDLRPSSSGLYGDYFAPSPGTGTGAGVVMFGGSGGGLFVPSAAALLASHGYRVLDLAYFNEPGLPPQLLDIPLEYFERAIAWLAEQPGVDPNKIAVSGVSRGSEAALLLGVNDSQAVRGVIALVPNDAALCGFPDCSGPAWTLGGAPVPYTRLFDSPTPPDQPDAVIPVERIRGPIFMDCGGEDAVWVSCPFADAIQARLKAAGSVYRSVLLRYPRAGHQIGDMMPFLPYYVSTQGGDNMSEAEARVQQWPELLDFLHGL